MKIRYDTLGRRIPEFDRSAANKKAAKTRKEVHGIDDHARAGAIGGRARGRGYFGKLKDEGNEEELRALSKKARKVKESNKSLEKTKDGKDLLC